jgi:hypothetical protein
VRWWIAIVLAAGCYQRAAEQDCTVACGPSLECPDGTHCSNGMCGATTCGLGGSGDAGVTGDAGGTCTQFGHAGFRPCVQTIGGAAVLEDGATLPGPYACEMIAQASGPHVCVLAFESVEVSGAITVAGSAPIALIGRAFIKIDIAGKLDAASHVSGGALGAGANPASCATTLDGGSGMYGGGGAGGTFAAVGGAGGFASGVSGGDPSTVVLAPYPVEGGCNAGSGGQGASDTATPGGAGGGAIALYSLGPIEINGIVDASGAGAVAPQLTAGGGGGGTGGFIGIDGDPAQYVFAGTIYADGGGGSSGCDSTTPSTQGSDPSVSFPGAAPIVGAGGIAISTRAGSGGSGGTRNGGAVGGGSSGSGGSGGGGGGSIGVIAIYGYSGTPPVTIDPAPSSP